MTLTPTAEQSTIINAVSNGKTLKVAALAGTGKTSTLVMIANHYPRRRGLYLAYNTALKEDALKKFPHWVSCKTVHGLAYREFGARYRRQLSIRSDSLTIAASLDISSFSFTIEQEKTTLSALAMVRFAKDIVARFTFSDREEISFEDVSSFMNYEIYKNYPLLNLDPLPNEKKSPKEFLETKSRNETIQDIVSKLNSVLLTYAKALWRAQVDTTNETVPANHDTYLKLYQLSKPIIDEYDYIMLDEAQDANPCILNILSHQRCQIIYVGDENQQIYAFRGTINAMEKIEAGTLYLTQSFRFGDAIAKEANVILEKLKSPSYVKGLESIDSRLEEVTTPYTFIARTNLTLIQECIDKIQEGFKCCLLVNVKGIVSLIKSVFYLWIKKPEWIKDDRVCGFPDFKTFAQFAREEEDGELAVALNFVMKNQMETLDNLKILEAAATYSEKNADIILSTAHKSKGREWDNVSLAKDDFSLKNNSEMNLYYVALTRAKHILHHTFPTDAKIACQGILILKKERIKRMDIFIEVVRWVSLVIICIGFLVFGKQVRDQEREIEKLQDDIDWSEEAVRVVSNKVSDIIRLNNLKDAEE